VFIDAILSCTYGGALATINEHLLYASSNHLGRGYRGKMTGGSTTAIVDTTVNFTTLGMSTSAGSNKVYNVDNGEVYTITSITTTTNADDTLNFAAGAANSADDYYVCFKDNFKKFNTSIKTGNHFTGQSTPISWKRQIVLWEDNYYILNGNYIATLNEDEATFSETSKQLPARCQAVCMDINSSKMLVGAEFRDKGKLLLRDTFSSGWLNILDLKRQPLSIKAYRSGWLVSMGDSVYYTNGYSLELLSRVPFNYGGFNWGHTFDGMAIVDEKVYLVNRGTIYTRGRSGVYIFDIKEGGWSYCSMAVDETGITNNNVFSEYTSMGCLFAMPNFSTPRIYVNHSLSYGTNAYNIARIGVNGGSRASVISYTKLPRKMKLGTISLNLMSRIERIQQNLSTGLEVTIQVNYGQGKRRFGNSVQFKAGSSASVPINSLGAYGPGKIGQELLVVDGDLAGVRTFIKGIANGGTDSEALTISPAFETTPTANTTAMKYDLFSAGNKVVDIDNMPEELIFNIPEFYSDNLWIEIIITSNETAGALVDIHDINVW